MKESEFVVQRRKECIKMCVPIPPSLLPLIHAFRRLTLFSCDMQGGGASEGGEHCCGRVEGVRDHLERRGGSK